MTIASGQFGYDSAALGQRDRFDAYRQLYAPGADVAAIGDDFRVTMTGWRLDRALLYDRRLSGVAHERDDGRVRRDAMEHFTLTLVVAGEFHADGGEGFRRVRPGEVLLMDMTRPARNRAPSAHIVTMSMARERVARLAPSPRRLHGEVLAIEQAGLLGDHMASLARRGAALTPAMLMPVTRIGVDLLGAALAGAPDREYGAIDVAAARTDRVRAHIEERLFEPGFGPAAVMARFALSRATLYRDFQQWGGLAAYIRRRRLEALSERLADRDDHRSLAQLAAQLGFSTEARQSEAFLARFGLRPGAYREVARSEIGIAQSIRRMTEWQSVLR